MTARPTHRAAAREDRDDPAVPGPDDPRKAESPTELSGRSWRYVLRRTWHEVGDDQCTDLAAALTYYSVLSIFPAAIALVSLLGVVGRADESVRTVLDVLRPLVSPDTLGTIEPTLTELAGTRTAGLALVLGLAGSLWSASGYVGAFGRAMNRVYEIDEGRPVWKLRPAMLLLTAVILLLVAAVLVMLVVSGPLAESVGGVVGLSDAAVLVWSVAKWPAVLALVMLIVALLYYATPNVRQPRFRWLSVGAATAIVVAVVASVGFSAYVSTFGSYNKTYGSLAGVVVTLLFLWLVNLALLVGAEVDSELERGRQLQAGFEAERELQLPARDTSGIEKAQRKEAADVARGREIREQALAARADLEQHDRNDPQTTEEREPR